MGGLTRSRSDTALRPAFPTPFSRAPFAFSVAASISPARRWSLFGDIPQLGRSPSSKGRAEFPHHPDRSNRQIAVALGVDDTTVGDLRKRLEAVAGIPQLKTVKGKDGKTYKAKKPSKLKVVDDSEDVEGRAGGQLIGSVFGLLSRNSSSV